MEIIRARPEHEEQILALARRALGWDADPRFTDLYRWKHDQNPFGDSPRWVALDGDRVVGFRVFLRWRFRRPDGRTVDAVRAVDTATDPDHQGRGIFRSLTLAALEELREEGIGFVFNTPNDKSRPGYLKMGWVELGRPRVSVAPRVRSLRRILGARTAAEHWSTPCPVGLPAPGYLAAVGDHVPGSDTDPGTDAWRTDRSPAFLAWRYGLDHLDYRVLTTGDLPRGDRLPEGAAVFRMRRRGAALEATVAEVLAPRQARTALLRGVLRASGADYVLTAGARRVEAVPAIALGAFSPLVTWRAVTITTQPAIEDLAFSVGDLELF